MKRALVTGAGGRIGREIAIYLASRGYDIAVHYASSEAGALETVDLIKAQGGHAVSVQADLLDEAQSQHLVARSVDGLGGNLTCLVNNASIFENDSIATGTRRSWDRHIESNLRAPYVLIQNFAAQAPKATTDANGEPVAQCSVINMIDQRVRKLTPQFSSYTIAKMGLWALTRTASQELAPNIRVNAIGPGPTLKGAHQSDDSFAAQRAATVLQRGSDPADICAAVGYLLDARAVTGQLLCVDGGQHLGWETPDIDL